MQENKNSSSTLVTMGWYDYFIQWRIPVLGLSYLVFLYFLFKTSGTTAADALQVLWMASILYVAIWAFLEHCYWFLFPKGIGWYKCWGAFIHIHLAMAPIFFTLIHIFVAGDAETLDPYSIAVYVLFQLALTGWLARRHYRNCYRPYRYGKETKAVVTYRENAQMGAGFALYVTCAIQAKFTDCHSQEHHMHYWNFLTAALDDVQVGSHVNIRYDPEHPERSVWADVSHLNKAEPVQEEKGTTLLS